MLPIVDNVNLSKSNGVGDSTKQFFHRLRVVPASSAEVQKSFLQDFCSPLYTLLRWLSMAILVDGC